MDRVDERNVPDGELMGLRATEDELRQQVRNLCRRIYYDEHHAQCMRLVLLQAALLEQVLDALERRPPTAGGAA